VKLDFSKLNRYKIKERFSKVETSLFASKFEKSGSFESFLKILPDTLKAKDLRERITTLSGVVRSGWIKHLVFNGSGMIHDFEIAFNASTSENVDKAIEDGSFGMAYETGKFINEAITDPEKGLGYNLGKYISESDFPNKEMSILAACYECNIPATVHVAMGTDIIHYHPEFDPKATGLATHRDFEKFVDSVSELEGGALLNFGSAVIVPEIFLKAITVVRNLGVDLRELYTANFDFLHQYRSAINVVKRPTSLGGKGYYFIGHHEIMMPMLYAGLKEAIGE
jgi:hypothetical protein